MNKKLLPLITIGLCGFVLTSCGGGGGTPSTNPSTNPSIAPSTNPSGEPTHQHIWLPTDYEWSDDNEKCEAIRICELDASHVEREIVDTTREEISPATCEHSGEILYKAEFTNPDFLTQYRYEYPEPVDHLYGEVEYEWSADYLRCTAKRVCQYNPDHFIYEEVFTTSGEIIDPTYTTEGSITYYASFENYPDTSITVIVPSLERFSYELNSDRNGYIVAQNGYGTRDTLEIPSTYNDLPVVGIKSYGFSGNLFTEIIIPDSITSIGSNAFNCCENVSQIIIPSSVKYIGSYAFSSMPRLVEIVNLSSFECNLDNLCYEHNDTYLVNSLADSKYSVNKDGLCLYQKDEDLKVVNYIGENKNVYIPNEVTAIRSFAFYHLDIEHVEMADSVKIIEESAFNYCKKLLSIDLSSSLNTIGVEAFYYCSSLRSIKIPDKVSWIQLRAFAYCSSLSQVILGSSVSSIDSYAFGDNYRLVEVVNKSNLEIRAGKEDYGYIGYYLKSLINNIDNSKLETSEEGYLTITHGGKVLLVDYYGIEKNIVIPSNVDIINIGALSNKDIEQVVVNSNVKDIGERAFAYCKKLKVVDIKASVVDIKEGTFSNCELIESITIPYTVEELGSYIARETRIKEFNIGNPNNISQLENIDDYAFGSVNIEKINYYGSLYRWTSINGKKSFVKDGYVRGIHLFLDGEEETREIKDYPSKETVRPYEFARCVGLYSVSLPDYVTSIEDNAFYNCENLISVVLPQQLNNVSNNAFESCVKLSEVINHSSLSVSSIDYLKDADYVLSGDYPSLLKINSKGFAYIERNNEVYLKAYFGSDTVVEIPEGVTIIDRFAFYENEDITEVILPTSIKELKEYAIGHCYGITKASYLGTVEEYFNIKKADWGSSWSGTYQIKYISCLDGNASL